MIENLENEQWKTIDGYEDYEVSNYGRVKSLERIDNLGRTIKEKILKQSTNNNGYQQVCLCKNGKRKMFQVHRLVANAFIPNPNNYAEINHKDECKTNNHVSNLEWCNRKYNCNYGSFIEKHSGENNPKTMFGKFGKEHPTSKKVIQLTLENEVVRNWNSMMDIKRELGYNQGNISSCCRGRYKSAHGYKWKYTNTE